MDSDAHLVELCLQGDASAWAQLVQRHTVRLYQLFYRFTGNRQQAEDLTQDVFVRLFQSLPSYRPAAGSFKTWITTIGRNLLTDSYRKGRWDRQTSSIEEDGTGIARRPSAGPSPENVAVQEEIGARIGEALRTLRPELREAVILRDLQELDYREIQHVLGVPEGTVKSRINRGRIELARALERMGLKTE